MTKSILKLPVKNFAAAAALLVCSCSAPKDIAYFQDAPALQNMALQAEQQFKLRPEDKINIVVNSSNPMLERQFTLTSPTTSGGILGAETKPVTTAGAGSSQQMPAYTVDEQGTIDFPVLGKIRAEGMTRTELAGYIKERLVTRELVTDPIVTVEYVNLSVNVLGEVNKPGNVAITKDHFTILDALARAGDLTIDGKRTNVMVNRQADGANQVYYIDLTNMQTMLLSPAYYLQQNDIVYVMPNDKKKRQSTASQNAFHNPTLWISILSLAATLTAIFIK